jgi:hypothetical protein
MRLDSLVEQATYGGATAIRVAVDGKAAGVISVAIGCGRRATPSHACGAG